MPSTFGEEFVESKKGYLNKVQTLWEEAKLPSKTIDAIKNTMLWLDMSILTNMGNKTSRWIYEKAHWVKLPKTIKWTKEMITNITNIKEFVREKDKQLRKIREEANKKKTIQDIIKGK